MISRAIQLSRTAAALRRQTSAVAPPLARPPAAPAASFPPGRQTQRPFGDSAGDGGGGKIGTSDLAKRVAMDRGITLTASREIIYSVVDCITEATASGETVSIAGFGKFEPVIQKANQNQTNPQDPKGPKLQIPEKRRVKFRPYKHLAGVVEGTEEHKRRSGKD
mmetsp:Transcript_9192/g.19760  ORF Transcript_9192/g.19760 Transcript_9192/m.19760 type:complete len:164 (-) Transcript_9192:8-499(-)